MRLYALAVAVLVLAGCATAQDTPAQPSISSTGPQLGASGAGFGPGISVSEARRSRLDGPLLVNGYIVAEGTRVRLCEALAESFPPQCGGASLDVRGLDVATLSSLESSGTTRWTAQPRQLLGEVRNGVLTVSSTSKG
jgi:hypothetical protein